jgi:hypothetical protein
MSPTIFLTPARQVDTLLGHPEALTFRRAHARRLGRPWAAYGTVGTLRRLGPETRGAAGIGPLEEGSPPGPAPAYYG